MTSRLRAPMLAIALATTCAAGAPAHADGLRQACMADFHKFCSGAAAVLGPMRCMRQHAAELSDGCKQAWAARQKPKSAPPSDKTSG